MHTPVITTAAGSRRHRSPRRGAAGLRLKRTVRLLAPMLVPVLVPVLPLWLCATTAHAQSTSSSGSNNGVTIAPSFTVQQTLTSNGSLSSGGRRADAITELSPGIRIDSRDGRVQGSLAYRLNAIAYARDSDQNNLQNALDANLHADLLDGHFLLDGGANIAQRSISAFGLQGGDPTLRNANRSEVASANVAPTLRGNFGGFASYTVGARLAASRSDNSVLGDSTSRGVNLGLNGGTGFLAWGVSANRDSYSFKNSRATQTDSVGASLTYIARYDLRFTLRGGTSRSNVLTADREAKSTNGWSIDWQPTERTDIALSGDETYYGRSHSYSLRHRMARSVWSYVDTSSVAGPVNGQSGGAQTLTLYDLFFNICLAGGTSATECDRVVRNQLALAGADPSGLVSLGFLNGALTLQRSQVLSVSYSALRTTFTASAARNETRPLGPGSAVGDLSQGLPVRQQSVLFGASHQLTPQSTLSLTAAQQRTPSVGALAGNQLRSLLLGWSLAAGPHTNVTLSARHSRFNSDNTNAYTESALLGSVGVRF